MNAPLFFNVFLDSICAYIKSKASELGFRLASNIDGHLTGRRRPNGVVPCWILLYAGDMEIFEKNGEQMQAVRAVVHQALKDWGMQMSISKTKYLHYGRAQHLSEPLHIAGHEIEQASKFKYLDSMQTSDLSARAQVSNRLAVAASAWLETSWMKCLRKICKVSLKDKIRNEVILGWCNVARVSNIVSHRGSKWLGHLVRMPDVRLPKRVLSGHMDGSGVRGRSQKQWVGYVREDLQNPGLLFTLWRKSQDRAGWRAAIECLLQRT